MNPSSKVYFYLSLLVTVPIGVGSAFFNYLTLKVMSSFFEGYPETVHVASYTPDTFVIKLHLLGFEGVLALLVIYLGLVVFVTFKRKSNKTNFALFTIATLFFTISLVWCLTPMIVLATY